MGEGGKAKHEMEEKNRTQMQCVAKNQEQSGNVKIVTIIRTEHNTIANRRASNIQKVSTRHEASQHNECWSQKTTKSPSKKIKSVKIQTTHTLVLCHGGKSESMALRDGGMIMDA